MYAQLEEDHGLAKRSMAIYDRATQTVADADKFEVCPHGVFFLLLLKLKSASDVHYLRRQGNRQFWSAGYSTNLRTSSGGYVCLKIRNKLMTDTLAVLPDRQTAEMCLRFAALERKLGEIDRARAIYAHASQFCDPRVNPQFWSEWNTFEIETGSEDTFREMLRIKRSVQAQFNTEASYLAAQTMAARQGTTKANDDVVVDSQDAMAAAERQAAGGIKGPAFVAATATKLTLPDATAQDGLTAAPTANADEIQISDDEDL